MVRLGEPFLFYTKNNIPGATAAIGLCVYTQQHFNYHISIAPTFAQMKDFKKYYIIPATPEEIYIALTNPATIQLWSGTPAEMSTEPGSEFSLWEGNIVGRNIAFEESKKIQQEWYFGDQEPPSIVTIKLHPHKHGCSAELLHTNIPDEAYEEMVQGWDENYFGLLEEFYN